MAEGGSGVRDDMRLIRDHTALRRLSQEDEIYVDAPPKERISFVWELTAELWSLKGPEYVERRLQRNVTILIKK